MYSVLIAVLSAGTACAQPIARAGRTFLAYPAESIRLDGSASEGEQLAYRWVQTGGPRVPLEGADTVRPSFYTDHPGRYTFELTVREDDSDASIDEVDVVILDPEVGTRYAPASGCTHATPLAPALWLLFPGTIGLVRRQRQDHGI